MGKSNVKDREIIFITLCLAGGGVERIISLLANSWADKGYKVRIVELCSDVEGIDHYNINSGVKIEKHDFAISKYFGKAQIILFLVFFLIRHRHEHIVVLNTVLHIYLYIVSFLPCNLIVSERDDPYMDLGKKLYRKFRDGVFENFASKCVFQTADAMNYFSKKIQSKSVVIPNPVNPNLPDLFKGDRRKVIVGVGWLIGRKNWEMSIRAFAKFYEYHSDYVFEIYGKGSNENKLKELINALRMEGKIFLKGFAEDVNEIMNDCSIYVSSSDAEGISNSMIEAMAMAMPVICTDCPIGGARMMIQNDVNGLLVPVGDVEALYLAFRRMVEEPGLAERLGNEAYKVRSKYSIDEISDRWLDVIFK